MKLAKIFTLFTVFLSFVPISAFAETPSTEEVGKPAPEMSSADKAKLKVLRERIDKAREELNGSFWQVSYKTNAPDAKAQKDTFTFQDSVFKSEAFSKRGFTSTNYTVSMASEDSDRGIYETMLSSKEGVIFLRGEWEKEQMSGRITEQLDGGKKILDYAFTTSARKAIPPQSDKEKGGASPDSKDDAAEVSAVLVSKEKADAPDVTPFKPGTTEESLGESLTKELN